MLTGVRFSSRLALIITGLVLVGGGFLAGQATGAQPGPAVGVLPGPDRRVDGVTLGFSDTRAGAEAAAAHDLLLIERAMDSLSITRTATIAGLVATAREAVALRAHAAAVIAIERADGAPLRRVAIATNLDSFSPTAAQVTVLEEWIYATAAREAVWAVERVSLRWGGGDWRVSAITGAAPSADESLTQLRAELAFPGAGDATVR